MSSKVVDEAWLVIAGTGVIIRKGTFERSEGPNRKDHAFALARYRTKQLSTLVYLERDDCLPAPVRSYLLFSSHRVEDMAIRVQQVCVA